MILLHSPFKRSVSFRIFELIVLCLLFVEISGTVIAQTSQKDGTANQSVFFEMPYLDCSLDAYTPAPGLAIEFYRTYLQDSQCPPCVGPFGYGWTHSFNLSLRASLGEMISFHGPSGTMIWFKKNVDGTYIAAPGYRGSLKKLENGTFILRGLGDRIYRFRADMLLDCISDGHANTISNIYDKKKRLVEVKHSNGASLKISYNILGKIALVTNSAKEKTQYEYSTEGNYLIRVLGPGNKSRTYAYETVGETNRLSRITFSDNTHAFYAYDSLGRISSYQRDGGLDLIKFRYEADGSTRIIDASGRETAIRQNELGQPLQITDAAGSTARFGYDLNHRISSISDPLNRTFQLYYNDLGDLISVADPLGNKMEFGYLAGSDKISGMKDRLGNALAFDYDSRDNLISILYPDGSKDQISYGQSELLKNKTSRDGNLIEYAFDERGLLISKKYPDNSSSDYVYDERGRLKCASNSFEKIDFEYDDADNLVGVTYPSGRTFKYEYDGSGRRNRAQDPDGRAIRYEYNESGLLMGIREEDGGRLADYQYDDSGRCTKRTLGNGAHTTYEYDPAGKISRLTNYGPNGSTISYFKYTYDSAGNLIAKESKEGKESYTYDNLNQLIGIIGPGGERTEIRYDSEGNRKTISKNGISSDYSVNNLNQYTSSGLRKLSYDKNGNMISDAGDQSVYYEYDAENRLLGVRTSKDNISYNYGPLGLICSRTDSNGTKNFLWDIDQIAIEEDADHKTKAKYVWGGALDEILKMNHGEEDYYYSQDALFSVDSLMSSSGEVLESYQYDPFGELKATQLTHGNPFFFAGAFRDSATKLCYNRYRYYSPDLGRFITPDPLGPISGTNLYAYDGNRYTIGRDPYGLYTSLAYSDSIRMVVTKEGMWEFSKFAIGLLLPTRYSLNSPNLVDPVWSVAYTLLSPFIGQPGEESYGSAKYRSLGGRIGDMPREYRDISLDSSPSSLAVYGVVSRIKMPVYQQEFKKAGAAIADYVKEPNKKESDQKVTPSGDSYDKFCPPYCQKKSIDSDSADKDDEKKSVGNSVTSSSSDSDAQKNMNSCEPFCDGGDGGNSGSSSGSPGVSTSKKKTASYGSGDSDVDQSTRWTVRSFLPVKKAENNPLTQGSSKFSDALQNSIPDSDVSSVGLKVEDNDATGEERYTLYRREAWQDSSLGPGNANGWTPISSKDAGQTLTVMGYKAPDSTHELIDNLDKINRLLEQLRTVQDSQRMIVETTLQRQQLEQITSQLEKSRNMALQLSRSLYQPNQLGGVDFSSVSLNYISMRSNSSGEKDFYFVLRAKKAGKNEPAVDLKNSTSLSSKAFLTGLAIANGKMWVNLNPWEPDRIIDKDLSHTDTGRIMLEADLLMKKDFCRYEDPCNSTTGQEHWKLLENKRAALVKSCMESYPGEIKDARNVLFSATTRHWIVPENLTAYGNEEEIYIDNLSMTIRSDPVSEHTEYRIVNQDTRSVSKDCLECLNRSSKEYGSYAMEVEKKSILPLVVLDINRDAKYVDLRQIYIALGMAQYYKDHRKKPNADMFSEIIKSHNLKGGEVVASWDPKEVWNSYVKSYKEGEYRCWQNETTTSPYEGYDGRMITRTSTDCRYYQEGGVDFSTIKDYIKIVGELSPAKKETLRKAIYTIYAEEGDEYYFGDGVYLLPQVMLLATA